MWYQVQAADLEFARKEQFRVAAVAAVYVKLLEHLEKEPPSLQLSPPANLNISSTLLFGEQCANYKKNLSTLRSDQIIINSKWEGIKNKKAADLQVILEYNHYLTGKACFFSNRPEMSDFILKVIEIKKYLNLLLVAISAENNSDVKIITEAIQSPLFATKKTIIDPITGLQPSESFKVCEKTRGDLNTHLQRLENYFKTRYKENYVLSYYNFMDKVAILFQGYDTLMMSIHRLPVEFPDHHQGRLGSILGCIEFELKPAFPSIQFKKY